MLDKLHNLIAEFILKSPEFDGDIVLAAKIGLAMADVAEEIRNN